MMKKLTAEKCREMIHDMSVKRDFNGLSIREDRYFEALEIALPVLEQQEKGEGDWIEWFGGECPVEPRVEVEFKQRDGQEDTAPSKWLDWTHENRSYDIIAYRVIEQQERERGEEE